MLCPAFLVAESYVQTTKDLQREFIRTDLSTREIAEIFYYHWQIEIFFRWFKCVMKCRHLFAESNNGMALQIYAALIASVLIVVYTGRKPTKQLLFVLHLYLCGNCDYERVANEIRKLKPTRP